jgi:hypothetical protein
MLSEISQAQKTNTARAHSKQIDILKAKTEMAVSRVQDGQGMRNGKISVKA